MNNAASKSPEVEPGNWNAGVEMKKTPRNWNAGADAVFPAFRGIFLYIEREGWVLVVIFESLRLAIYSFFLYRWC